MARSPVHVVTGRHPRGHGPSLVWLQGVTGLFSLARDRWYFLVLGVNEPCGMYCLGVRELASSSTAVSAGTLT